MKDIIVIQADEDWFGVYLDGKLMFEDTSPITVRDVVSLLDEKDEAVFLSFVDMIETDLTNRVNEDGEFPEDIPI